MSKRVAKKINKFFESRPLLGFTAFPNINHLIIVSKFEFMFIEKEIEDMVRGMFDPTLKTLDNSLGFEYTYISRNRLEALMPVDSRTKQPFGLLHGGASVALGESLCSFGAWLNIDSEKQAAVGMEINANHIRSARNGKVRGVAEPIFKGATSQLWKYEIYADNDKLICTGRCTLAIIQRKK